MTPTSPFESMFVVPPGTKRINFAEHQVEYITLPALVTPDGKVVSQWMPDANELALLNRGVPVTLVVHHGSLEKTRLKPVSLSVGGVDLR